MARAEVFASNLSKDKKSPRMPKIKVEYMEYLMNLKHERKPEQQDSKVALPKTTQRRRRGRKTALLKRLKQNNGKHVKKEFDNTLEMKNGVNQGPRRGMLKNVVLNADKAFNLPSPGGFQRIVVKRLKGVSAGKLDTYYVSPQGTKLRSRPDVTKYLTRCGITNLTADLFEFRSCYADVADFELVLGFAERFPKKLAENKVPTAAVPVRWRKVSVRLENIDHLLLKHSDKAADTNDNETEQPLEKPQDVHPESEAPEQEDELQLDQLNWLSVKTPRRWVPFKSPYKLIYEDPEINEDCWKLFTASIIIYYWKLNSFVHRFFQLFKNEEMVLTMKEEAIKPAMLSGMSCPKFLKTFSIIRAFTEDYREMKWKEPVELTGMLQYSLDVVSIFYFGKWLECKPSTHDLKMYIQFVNEKKSAGALL